LRISSLGSGSKGNSTLLQSKQTTLMVDCGFGIRETLKRLNELGIDPNTIDAILVTHEHQDHIAGVESLAAKFGMPVYMSEGTAVKWLSRSRAKSRAKSSVKQEVKPRVTPNIIRADNEFDLGCFHIHPVPVPHDAKEPLQFVFQSENHKIGILTDLGSLTPHILTAYSGCQVLIVEANHDLNMLENGAYPYSLKKRVAGMWGHLNNHQTAEFIAHIDKENCLRHIMIGHISEQNNQLELVKEALSQASVSMDKITFFSQLKSMNWYIDREKVL